MAGRLSWCPSVFWHVLSHYSVPGIELGAVMSHVRGWHTITMEGLLKYCSLWKGQISERTHGTRGQPPAQVVCGCTSSTPLFQAWTEAKGKGDSSHRIAGEYRPRTIIVKNTFWEMKPQRQLKTHCHLMMGTTAVLFMLFIVPQLHPCVFQIVGQDPQKDHKLNRLHSAILFCKENKRDQGYYTGSAKFSEALIRLCVCVHMKEDSGVWQLSRFWHQNLISAQSQVPTLPHDLWQVIGSR